MADLDGPPSAEQTQTATPFHDLSAYVAVPRLSGLALSPDGSRLVTAVAQVSSDRKKYVTALWEIDPNGVRAARRLTRSAPGESQPVFAPDGSLLFTSTRPDADQPSDPDAPEVAGLWLLPGSGGEARRVADRPGGVDAVAVADQTGGVLFTASVLAGSTSREDDEKRRKARKDAGVSAILHESYPIRHWDHDLGPDHPRVFAAGRVPGEDGRLDPPRDLTPLPEGRIEEGLAISADGALAAVVWRVEDPVSQRLSTVILDTASGDRRLVVDDPAADFFQPAFSPDGTALVCVRESLGRWDAAPERTLWLVELETGIGRELLSATPHWPTSPVFARDGAAVFFVSDDHGHAPVFRVELADSFVSRLTAAGAYSDLVVAQHGTALYALRSGIAEPPTPVRLDPRALDQDGAALPSPGRLDQLPGMVVEVTGHADDDQPLRAWLALPHGASAESPAPLLLWIHGGPLSSWNAWSWRWNPWLMVAQGYAVLLPDPALSTGYDRDFVNRGWGSWGQRPYTDLMAITDVACARDDVDDSRTAAMGGSFGGYMANWVATQTDRFRAIITHASLWHLDQFAGTTDEPAYWHQEFGDPLTDLSRYAANSPHLRVEDIRTPMLVVHGDKDYRVPIGEALRLWYDLRRFSVPAKFLYFPDENHWVLTPGHARIWYETVLAFLAEHVLGKDWQRPELL